MSRPGHASPPPPRLPAELAAEPTSTLADGTDLDGVLLRDATLDHPAVADVEMSRSHVVGAVLTGATLERWRLTDVVLENCELSGVSLERASFERVELRACRLSGFVAPGLVARSLTASDCRLDGAVLSGATIERSALRDCDLRRADLSRARLTGTALLRCDLRGIDLDRARCAGLLLFGSRLDEVRSAESLRGAVIAPDQLAELAVSLVDGLGITVADPDEAAEIAGLPAGR